MSAPDGRQAPPELAVAIPKTMQPVPEGHLRRDLAIATILLAAIVNPGELYSVDAARRLQVARWIWAGEPSVAAGDWGLPGVGGGQHYIFGLGQSLVMIPFDVIAAAAVSAISSVWPLDQHVEEGMRVVILAVLMQSVIAVAGVLTAFSLLRRLEFTAKESAAGALGLVLGTTYLHYVQNCQENNLLLLTALIGFERSLRWLSEPLRRHAIIAGIAMGSGLLVRLTAAADFLALCLFLVLVLTWRMGGVSRAIQRSWDFLRVFLVPYAVFGLADRAYHYYRFGEFSSTYMHIWGRHEQQNGAPQGFPFGYPFADGFWGALISPDNSIFLFDPLLVVTIVAAVFSWKRLAPAVRGFLLAGTFLLFFQVCFHATFYTYGGEVSWGDRFVASPVHLLSLGALALLLREGRNITLRGVRGLLWALVPLSVLIQIVSTTLNMSVEHIQMKQGHSRLVLANRMDNVWSVLSGQAAEEAAFDGVPEDWQVLNFLPFRLKRRYPTTARVAFIPWVALVVIFWVHVWRLLLRTKQLPMARTAPAGLSSR